MRGLLLIVAACQPGPTDPSLSPPCPEDEGSDYATTGVYVGEVCDSLFLNNGEGKGSDFALANDLFRAVIRSPVASLSLPGLGGGTLVDAAPWGFADHLHEVVPLVGGGWLDTDGLEVLADRIVVRGVIASLPDEPAPRAGETAQVAWVVYPDDPWLHVEGAEGLYIHPAGEVGLYDGWLVHRGGTVYGHDGDTVNDLGGAIRVNGASALLIDASTTAWAHRPESLVSLTGTATGAERVLLYTDTKVVGWISVEDDAFSAQIPQSVTDVQAVSGVSLPSVVVPAGENLSLDVGATAQLTVIPSWGTHQRPRPLRVSWPAAWPGAPDHALVGVTGGSIQVPARSTLVSFSAGPTFEPSSQTLDLTADLATVVHLTSRSHADDWVMAAIGVRPDRSRARRSTDKDVLREALLDGVDLAVLTAEDDVSNAEAYADDEAWIRWSDGARLTSVGGPTVVSWPWRSDDRFGGHGAGYNQDRTPLESLRIAWGGAGTDRFTQVDLAWMNAVDMEPWTVEPQPDFVLLGHPGGDPSTAWAAWWPWLDAGLDVHPSGPKHHVRVDDDALFGSPDVMRGLIRGQCVATTGPLVELWVDGFVPGDLWEPSVSDLSGTSGQRTFGQRIEVKITDPTVDTVAVYGEGGVEFRRWEVDAVPFFAETQAVVGRWAVAAAWSAASPNWAVTAPVWVNVPGQGRIPPWDESPSQ